MSSQTSKIAGHRRLDQARERRKDSAAPRPRSPLWLHVVLPALISAVVSGTLTLALPGLWEGARRATGTGSLTVSVIPGDMTSAGDMEFLWPRTTKQIPDVSSTADAHGLGAIDVLTTFRLTIRSTFDERVTIHRWELVNLAKTPAFVGLASSTMLAQTGGGSTPRGLEVSVPDGAMTWSEGGEAQRVSPPVLYVHDDDEEIVDVRANAVRCVCRWTLKLFYSVAGGDVESQAITAPDGKPFVTASTESSAWVFPDSCEPPQNAPQLCKGVKLQLPEGYAGEEGSAGPDGEPEPTTGGGI